MIKSIFSRSFAGVLFPIAFICILFDEQLGITAITPWTILLSAAFGSFGLSMIFYKGPKWPYNKYSSYNKSDWECHEYETIDTEDESHIRLHTSFAGSIKYINTYKFEQVYLKCSFGSMKVYFDNATLHNGRGIVRVDASFFGLELYVPKTWTIENRNFGTSFNVLVLVGNISFSSVEVIYI